MLPQLHMPPSQIKKAYTAGGEYIIANVNDRREYVGYLHIYPNGAVYSGDKYTSDSIELLLVPTQYFNSQYNGTYFKLTRAAFYNHTDPRHYMFEPTKDDRKKGVVKRYFACKRNEDIIIEVDSKQVQAANVSNKKGINARIWRMISLEWTISGNTNEVQRANNRVISVASRKVPYIRTYLADLLEFYQ